MKILYVICTTCGLKLPPHTTCCCMSDTSDPQLLADIVADHHDYPSADMLGHFIAD